MSTRKFYIYFFQSDFLAIKTPFLVFSRRGGGGRSGAVATRLLSDDDDQTTSASADPGVAFLQEMVHNVDGLQTVDIG